MCTSHALNPVIRLPFEVLIQIFHEVFTYFSPTLHHQSLWDLMLVCKIWRHVIVELCPEFWAHIPEYCLSRPLKRKLERSRQLPITFSAHIYSDDSEGTNVLMQNCHRWKSAHLVSPSWDGEDGEDEQEQAVGRRWPAPIEFGDVPILEELTITPELNEYTRKTFLPLVVGSTPKVRKLKLGCPIIWRRSTLFFGLRHLRLDRIQKKLNVAEFIQVLTQNPDLENLEVSDCVFEYESIWDVIEVEQSPVAMLSKLTSITLDDIDCTAFGHIAQRLELPACREFRLDAPYVGGWGEVDMDPEGAGLGASLIRRLNNLCGVTIHLSVDISEEFCRLQIRAKDEEDFPFSIAVSWRIAIDPVHAIIRWAYTMFRLATWPVDTFCIEGLPWTDPTIFLRELRLVDELHLIDLEDGVQPVLRYLSSFEHQDDEVNWPLPQLGSLRISGYSSVKRSDVTRMLNSRYDKVQLPLLAVGSNKIIKNMPRPTVKRPTKLRRLSFRDIAVLPDPEWTWEVENIVGPGVLHYTEHCGSDGDSGGSDDCVAPLEFKSDTDLSDAGGDLAGSGQNVEW